MRAQLAKGMQVLVQERRRRPRAWYRVIAVIRFLAAVLVSAPILVDGHGLARAGQLVSIGNAALILFVLSVPGGRRFDRFWAYPPVLDTVLVLMSIALTGGARSDLGWLTIMHGGYLAFFYGGVIGAVLGSLMTLAVAAMVILDPLAPQVTMQLTYLLMMWGVFGVITYLGVLTERYRERADVQGRRAQDLEALSSAKQQFIHIASHELRTPLTVVKGYNALLLAQLKARGDLELGSYAHEISRAADRMGLLIDELMDFGRMQSGQLPLQVEAFAYDRMASDVVKVLGVLASQRQQRLVLELHGARTLVTADPRRLEQVLINLLRNALKYSSEGTVVTVRVRYAAEQVRTEVHDQGPGIHPEHMPHLFTPFYRARPEADPTEGVGLGLAICHGIVQAHGGRIGAESTPGEGSLFWFELPLTRVAVPV